ncbi:hypothetical protein PIB30_045905 [Stylosanthes scabra]|uniref:Pentatricopeptide repeat-containing protein n=1 Tax=Stylosanthes scabra TaxID=79078 RepID=A0ABU6VGB4_9FABA|nr:hypothetical protein [Stylosanthes scabra]
MHALCLFPSKGNHSVVPSVIAGFEASPSPNRRRTTKVGFVFSLCRGTSFCDIRFSRSFSSCYSTVSCVGNPNFDLRLGFLFGYSKLKFVTPLAWALEDQGIGNELVEGQSNSIESSSVSETANSLNTDQSKGINSEQEMHDGECSGNELFEQQTVSADKGINCEQEVQSDDKAGKGGGEEIDVKVNVKELASILQSVKTVEEVEDILKEKGELPLQVYSTIIKGFGQDKKMDSALILFNWMKRKKIETNGSFGPNLYIYNALLGVVKQSEQFDEMETILNEMARDGISYNVVTYNTLMAIYIEKGEAGKALDMLEEIHRNGFIPTPVSYSQALLAYRRMEDGNGALNFLVDFREKYRQGGIGSDDDGEDWEKELLKLEKFTIRVCYQVMRRWLVSHDNSSNNVLKLLIDMDNAGIPLGRADLERLAWACTREDHYIVIKEVYTRIRERHDKISLSVCNHVIWLMGKARKWWAALEIYEDLLDKGPKPNNLSYELITSHFNFLLNAAKKKGIWRWGAAETTAAVQIFKRMVENGEKPTVISYGALLSALEKGKLYDEALRVWDHMIKVGVEPNAYAYTIMASIYTAQGNFSRVDAIIREMVTLGIEITVVTYNAIISGCARNGMSSAAYEWFHRMKVQNISPNEITYEMLIEALSNDGKPRLAYELYMRAQTEGLILSSKAYDLVVQSSEAYGATINLTSLGQRPLDKKKKVQIRKTMKEFYNLADVSRRSSKPFDESEIFYTQSQELN